MPLRLKFLCETSLCDLRVSAQSDMWPIHQERDLLTRILLNEITAVESRFDAYCQYLSIQCDNSQCHDGCQILASFILKGLQKHEKFKGYGWDQKSYQCSKNNDMIACVLQQLCFNAEAWCFHCYVKRLLKVHPKAIFLMTLIMKFNFISFFSKSLHQLRPKVGIAKPTKMEKKQRTKCDWHEYLVERILFFPK